MEAKSDSDLRAVVPNQIRAIACSRDRSAMVFRIGRRAVVTLQRLSYRTARKYVNIKGNGEVLTALPGLCETSS